MDQSRLKTICELQKSILLKALDIVEPEGCVVYSTCSLSRNQNEGVVESTISEINSNKSLFYEIRVEKMFEFEEKKDTLAWLGLKESSLENTFRISPGPNSASAMYIAKLRKKVKTPSKPFENLNEHTSKTQLKTSKKQIK
jgi:16S rRNA C967 or C1407 C5-methylase (RsmB/RsmF family)